MKQFTFLSCLLVLVFVTGCSHNPQTAEVWRHRQLPLPCAGHAGGLVNGKLFVAGGNNWSGDRKTKAWLNNSYYFENSEWHEGKPLPVPVGNPMYASDDSGLYICGGNDGKMRLKSTFCFKELQTAPVELAELPQATDSGAGTIVDRFFYVTCGTDSNGLSKKLWRLDTSEKGAQWMQCADLPGRAREYPAVVACGKYIYVLGGVVLEQNKPGLTVLNDAYRYDPRINKWQRLKDLPLGGYAWSASPVDKHMALIVGRAFENSTVSDDILLVDLDTMSVQVIGKLPQPACAAPLVKNGKRKWFYLGGEPAATRIRTAQVSVINLK